MNQATADSNDIEDDLEWEEWDGRSPFLHHCVAGSIAGVAEHTLLYPFDTIKTHMQSYCADCPHAAVQNAKTGNALTSPSLSSGVRVSMAKVSSSDHGMWKTMQNLVNGHPEIRTTTGNKSSTAHVTRSATHFAGATYVLPEATAKLTAEAAADAAVRARNNTAVGIGRLWRGVQTMAVGCAPAHALYFSSYEAVKGIFLNYQGDRNNHHLSPIGSSVAGATATLFHDLIMTPLDTIKQRLQLGHYQGMYNGFQHIIQNEGYVGLYRSFPVTLLTNLPYGVIMMSTNEFLKEVLIPDGQFDLESSLIAGSAAGFTASALTTPLDRVKTRLQTQAMGSAVQDGTVAGVGGVGTSMSQSIETNNAQSTACGNRTKTKCGKLLLLEHQQNFVKYVGWKEAMNSIIAEEGYAGLFRGLAPRVMMHAPAVAISWTTYEGAKKWLLTSS